MAVKATKVDDWALASGALELARRLDRIAAIISTVDNRCMAGEGAVTPTLQEMRQSEISEIYQLANGWRKT